MHESPSREPCPYFLELVVGRCLWCVGPPGLNSLEEIVWAFWSQATNFIFTNPALEKLSCFECSRLLCIHVKFPNLSLNYAIVYLDSSMLLFLVPHIFLIASLLDLGRSLSLLVKRFSI